MSRRFKFSLRLFALIAFLIAVVTCVFGIRYQLDRKPETTTTQWSNFNSPAYSKSDNWGLYRHDRGGRIDVAILPNLKGLTALRELNAEANVEMLAIASDDVFQAIEFAEFTSIRRIALTELNLNQGWIDRLTPLRNLEYVCLTEFNKDPLLTIRELEKLTQLKELVIRTDQLRSLDDFPAMTQLESLLVKTVHLGDSDAARLQEKMPNCKIAISGDHYHRGLHDLDALSIEP